MATDTYWTQDTAVNQSPFRHEPSRFLLRTLLRLDRATWKPSCVFNRGGRWVVLFRTFIGVAVAVGIFSGQVAPSGAKTPAFRKVTPNDHEPFFELGSPPSGPGTGGLCSEGGLSDKCLLGGSAW